MLEGDGPTTSLEEMIKGTDRDWIHFRFDWKNMIVTGLTDALSSGGTSSEPGLQNP